MRKYMMTMNRFFCKRAIIACLFAIGLYTNIYGQESPTDLLRASQYLTLCNKDSNGEIKIYTEEQSIQNHDGKDVFCNKRKVEYRITEKKNKLVFKRKVLSSEKITLCDDEKDQLWIFPDVTHQLNCTILRPGKVKAETIATGYSWPVTRSTDGRVITFDETESAKKRSFKLWGKSVYYEREIEHIQYKSADCYCLDTIEKINTEEVFSITQKNKPKHTVTITETITVL